MKYYKVIKSFKVLVDEISVGLRYFVTYNESADLYRCELDLNSVEEDINIKYIELLMLLEYDMQFLEEIPYPEKGGE